MKDDTIRDSFSTSEEDELRGKYLTFWTDSQLFGVPIAEVVQIVGMQEITEIPDYPYYAKGIINLRGIIIPLIDMRLRLGKMEADYNDRTCVIVTNIHDNFFGLIVDEVDEVTDIADEQISPPPKMGGDAVNQYLTGVARLPDGSGGDKIVLAVDAKRILGESEFDALTQATL